MSNLKLVTTENFGNLECNFYRNMNDGILLTREQIGQALEYMDPAKAIQKIHLKHKDRLEGLCLRFSEIEKQLSVQQEQLNKLTTYKKPNNPWFVKMHPKYKLLEEYFNITRTELYKNILEKLKSVYGLDTNQIQADYCYRNRIESCYPLDPYEFNPKYREMIEKVVDDDLLKYGIITEK